MKHNLSIICEKLRALLQKSVEKNLAEGILLSGGLDTSILAFIASKMKSLKAFTVEYKKGLAQDTEYAKLIADRLGLRHFVHVFDDEELFHALSEVIKIMRSFDPMEIRNDTAIYIGLKLAKENGVSSIMTGDASDELFAGYSFFFGFENERLASELQKIWNIMRFSSVDLAKSLGIEAKLPYLDPEFKAFAMQIDPELKVRSENGRIYGKWILRKAFEHALPQQIVWRIKTPIEIGSGTRALTNMLSSIVSDREFEEKKQKYLNEDMVTIRDKEQLFYYEIYRSAFGTKRLKVKEGKICPFCHSNVDGASAYCRTCGAYPVWGLRWSK